VQQKQKKNILRTWGPESVGADRPNNVNVPKSGPDVKKVQRNELGLAKAHILGYDFSRGAASVLSHHARSTSILSSLLQ